MNGLYLYYFYNYFQLNDLDDCALYIITKGDVELIFESMEINEKIKRNSFKNYT